MIELHCYYSLSSPWAYLAGPQLQDIVRRHRVRLLLKPYRKEDLALILREVLAEAVE